MSNGRVFVQPRETPIYCCGQRTVAWFDKVLEVWKCARCGKPVKVAW